MSTDRILKENIEPTLSKYKDLVLSKMKYNSVSILGSGGKKASSGDLDLGFDTTQTIDDTSEILSQINIQHKVGKGFQQIWTKFNQYDENGEIPNKYVQIDLMFGNIDWLEFAYWSPNESETKYTAHHRSALLAAIIRYSKETILPDNTIETYVINWGTGVWTKIRSKYISTRGKNKGKELEKQVKSKYPIITDAQGVANLLTDNTNISWTIEDLKQPFEILWETTKKAFSRDLIADIAKYTKEAIEFRKSDMYIVPTELDEF